MAGVSGFSPWSTTTAGSAWRSPLGLNQWRLNGSLADTPLSGLRVVRELDALIARRGRPAMVVSDNGTELTSMAVLSWCQRTGIWG
jgi:hypothetical protein